MPLASASQTPTTARAPRRAGRPFFGLIESVIVEDPVEFQFDGAIRRSHAVAAWIWMVRDLAPELIDPDADDSKPETLRALDALLPDLLNRAEKAMGKGGGLNHRLAVQLGGEEPARRLPIVLNALKCHGLLGKAEAFGRATNGMENELALDRALQAMPFADQPLAALLMQATLSQTAQPQKLINAVIRISGSPTEIAITRMGFAPVIDAMLAHAQNQIRLVSQTGPFADFDLICRALDRYHRLKSAVTGYVELTRAGRWTTIAARLTKAVSERVEPHLRDVLADVNKALRRHREGTDRLDSDQLLSALNGVYLLATVRDARDSLALNAVFDQTWTQVGQALEIHIERNMDQLRANPADRITSERLESAIKMAELRFNTEYADVLRRAKTAAERR